MRSRGKRQVIEYQQVGTLARGNRTAQLVRVAAAVIQAKRLGRGEGRHGDSDHGVDTGLNRHAAGIVDHAGRKRIGRGTVVSIGDRLAKSWLHVPSRSITYMPRDSLSSASSGIVDSWSAIMPAAA